MSPTVVQKFGGSSLGDLEKIQKVALRVKAKREEGTRLVVVVSAMGDSTDELLGLARRLSADPPRRELDMLLTCGERISMALLSMALQELGVPAISFTGSQSGIITDDTHARARILEVRPERIERALDEGRVVIVAGYQGVSTKKEVTTLGRGGSDTTAVALAAALGADCEIYSDVDGVFTADPRVVPEAVKLASVGFEEMLELSGSGARVLNAQAVELAKARGVVIHARAAHQAGSGTTISAAPTSSAIAGVACDEQLWVLSTRGPASSFLRTLGAHRAPPRLLWSEQGRTVAVVSLEDVHNPAVVRGALHDVEVREDLATVTVVGSALGGDWSRVECALELAQAHSQAPLAVQASGLRLTLVVPKSGARVLTRDLHALLVGGAEQGKG